MKMLLRLAGAFLRKDLLTARCWTWLIEWIDASFSVAFLYVATRFLLKTNVLSSIPSADYFTFSLIGLALTQYVWRGFSSYLGRVSSGLSAGMLEPLWVTTPPFRVLLFLFGFWDFLVASLSALYVLSLGTLFFGAHLRWDGILLLMGVGSFTALAMVSLGILVASWSLVSTRASLLQLLFNKAAPLLSGAFFPITLFPGWLKGMAWCLPLTHALTLARSILLESAHGTMFYSWAALVGTTIFFVLASWIALAWALRSARTNGRLVAVL